MKYKSIILLVLTVIVLISVAGASASDANDTATDAQDNLEINEDTQVTEIGMDNSANEDSLNEPKKEVSTPELGKTNNEKLGNNISVSGNTFKDISDAIGNAESGDTILLDGITYKGSGSPIEIKKSLTLLGQKNTVLDAQGLSYILSISKLNNITIKNITFINGHDKTKSEPGAVYCYKSDVSISNCVFINNTADSDGGAIYCRYGNTTLSNCVFINNTADSNGGAIYCRYGNTTLSNCVFINNTADSDGGAIYYQNGNANISSCVFLNNSANTTKGGAIDLSTGDFNVSDCIFINNTAPTSSAISYQGNNCTVSNCIFINNTAETGQGTISYIGNYGNVSNCIFINNTADRDGGAISYMGTYGNVSNCIFINNTAEYGGAITYMGFYGNVSNCIFINNTAEYGGAIFYNGINGSISSCVFVNNTSNNGSSIHLYKNDTSTHSYSKINNNIFLNHVKGSEIYFYENDPTSNIDYNWFGSTVADYNVQPTFNNVNATVWLFLNAIANPDTIPVLGTSDISFKLYAYNKNSEKISEYDNTLLKPINLTITATNGDINRNHVNMGDIIRYSANNVGKCSVIATIANIKFGVELNVLQATTKITTSAVTTTYNKNKYLIVTLTDDKGAPISGEKITINIKGAKTYITDKNGQVKVNVGKLVPKTYNVKITFKGATNFKASDATVKVKVKKAKSKITAKKKTFKKSKKIKKYTVVLKSGKTLIKKAKLTLKINGKTYKAKTNKKGKATFKIKKLNKKGTFKTIIKYKGNKYYKKITKKIKIKVK